MLAATSSIPQLLRPLRSRVRLERDMRSVLLCAPHDEQDRLADLLDSFDYRVVPIADDSWPVSPGDDPIAAVVSDGVADFIRVSQALEGKCPVILVSDRTDVESRLAAAKAGVAALIRRPVNPFEVSEWLAQWSARDAATAFSVLIVDDDWLTSEVAAEVLRSVGFTVRSVNDPMLALRAIEDAHPDLVLMDMQMPRVDGLELARIIRQSRQFRTLPIVFLSAERDEARRSAASKFGGDGFIAKPIMPEALIALVRSRADRAGTACATGRDGLTGALHHAAFDERLVQELDRCSGTCTDVSLAHVHIDAYERLEDLRGQAMGQHVLQTLAGLLMADLRRIDVVGRRRGGHLGVIFPDRGVRAATSTIDGIRDSFARIVFNDHGTSFSATFSAVVSDPRLPQTDPE